MKIQNQSVFFCLGLLLWSVPVCLGQTQTPPPTQTQNPPGSTPYNPSVPSHRDAPSGAAISRSASLGADLRRLQMEARQRALNNRKPGTVLPIVLTEEELTPGERKALEPAPEDRKLHAEFLRQSGAGIFRLMRVDKEKHRRVVSVDNPDLTGDVLLLGGGAHYSFTKKNHNAGKWAELAWDEDAFVVGIGGDALGVLVDLGDVKLEELTLESPGLRYLTQFTPASTASAAEQQFHQLEKGITENGLRHALSAPWKLDTTYALRSINYGRADLLVAFRAVRQDTNGSLIVLWRKLKGYNTPNLKQDQK